eukprot:UN00582
MTLSDQIRAGVDLIDLEKGRNEQLKLEIKQRTKTVLESRKKVKCLRDKIRQRRTIIEDLIQRIDKKETAYSELLYLRSR